MQRSKPKRVNLVSPEEGVIVNKFNILLVLMLVGLTVAYGYNTYTNGNEEQDQKLRTKLEKFEVTPKPELLRVTVEEDNALSSEEYVNSLFTMQDLLDALCDVESNCTEDSIGDDGFAIGPYQIHYAYWFDAAEWDASLTLFEYEDCYNKEYAELVIIAYMERYVPGAIESFDPETIARTHNGGPHGMTKDSTIEYWKTVKSVMEENVRSSSIYYPGF